MLNNEGCNNVQRHLFSEIFSEKSRVYRYNWHQDDGAPPSPDYINFKDLIDTLNLKIEAFNIENGVKSAPKLHQTGERPLNKGRKRRYQFQAFRESEKANMMHLKDHKRFKMVQCLGKYFSKATEKSVQHLD